MLCHPCADIAFGVFARDVAAEIVEVSLLLSSSLLSLQVLEGPCALS